MILKSFKQHRNLSQRVLNLTTFTWRYWEFWNKILPFKKKTTPTNRLDLKIISNIIPFAHVDTCLVEAVFKKKNKNKNIVMNYVPHPPPFFFFNFSFFSCFLILGSIFFPTTLTLHPICNTPLYFKSYFLFWTLRSYFLFCNPQVPFSFFTILTPSPYLLAMTMM